MSTDPTKYGFDPVALAPAPAGGPAPTPAVPVPPPLPKTLLLPPPPAKDKPAATTPPVPAPAAEPPKSPVAPTPPPVPGRADWVAEVFKLMATPNRQKGVIAAGLLSLAGGAAAAKYFWPKQPASNTPAPDVARAATPEPAPLPAAPQPVVPPPSNPAVTPPGEFLMPPVIEVKLPGAPVPAPPTVSLEHAPVVKPTESAGFDPNLPLPIIPVPAAGMRINDPQVRPAAGTTAIDPPLPAPAVPPPAPAINPPVAPGGGGIAAPPVLPLPAVENLPVPKLNTDSGLPPLNLGTNLPVVVPSAAAAPPVPATPAPLDLPPPLNLGAPAAKPGEVPAPKPGDPPLMNLPPPVVGGAVPPPTAVPVQKPIEQPPVKPVEQPPPPKLELPAFNTNSPAPAAGPGTKPVSELPALPPVNPLAKSAADPLPAVRIDPAPPKPAPVAAPPLTFAPTKPPEPAAAPAGEVQTDFDVDLHDVRAGETYAAVSKLHFGDDRYAEALRAFNRNVAPDQTRQLQIPPIHVLRKQYAQLVGRGAADTGVKPAEWTTAPAARTEPQRGLGSRTYDVPPGGVTLKGIAKLAYGDESQWVKLWDLNPKMKPDETLPEGTRVTVPADAKVGR